jgi:hypothetical protein
MAYVNLLTNNWPYTRRIFKVGDIQNLVGKVASQGEGTQWIYNNFVSINVLE